MTSLLRIQPRLRAPSSIAYLSRPVFSLPRQRCYAQKSPKEEESHAENQDMKDASLRHPNHPIPSNKAEPTLHDGKQSPIADHEGNLRDDLPEDVKKHNEEVENRYDRPYNHIADDGDTEPAWKRK
ncbi:uncharacterized protein N7477_000174 [Penicillium maclennaniae]|uniref:uncharacterized protein n=1 Tax=Penicillium maclennaniae TaxID=1343394 RepID=UPI0025400729|nr:uncharacterized protein N7477_000174 [Penicillium maclennaniae]KAJ5683829.1 hypothetical protein N7477_000174 [Penicillium maclennaniae]